MKSYHDFLSSKRIIHRTSGINVDPAEFNHHLFEFQSALTHWALNQGRAALFCSTGLGKSLMQLEWARQVCRVGVHGRVLIVAPLTVGRQTVAEAAKFGLDTPIAYVRDGSQVAAGISVTNYEMVDHFDPAMFDGVVLDECFPAGTPVDTLDGPRPIESLRVGDALFNAAGVDVVSDVHRREVQYAVRITIAGHSIVCSPNHPVFTARGWVGARDLRPGDAVMATAAAMRMVWGGHHSESIAGSSQAVLRSVLLSEMAHESTGACREGAYTGSCSEARCETAGVATVRAPESRSRNRARSEPQPDARPGRSQEGLPHIESDEPRTFRAWGQWAWLDRATADVAGCTWERLDGGVRFVTGPTDSWLSHALQAGLGASRAQNRYRGGWQLTSQPEGAGREEGRETAFARVDGVEILEPGHPDLERCRDADGRIYFYDLGATRHPSFSVNGFLVHNSSILKALAGTTRRKLIAMFRETGYRLACTATPAPNDIAEIGNHAEFLGVMSHHEMLSAFFVHGDMGKGERQGWRLKGHAGDAFYRWLSSWAMSVRLPSDIGPYSDDGYILPELRYHGHFIDADYVPEGMLFATKLHGISDRAKVRKGTLAERVAQTAELVNGNDDQWIVWHGLNDEGYALEAAIPGAVLVEGSMTPDEKAARLESFQDGEHRVLLTKASIAGFGLNLQNCHRMVFCGMNDSWESYYQAIRRSWRFGQSEPVDVHVVLSELERPIFDNVMRKEREAEQMIGRLIESVAEYERLELAGEAESFQYAEDTASHDGWRMMLGDSTERMGELDDESVDFSVFSPPFWSLFVYTPSERDVGNSRTAEDFFQHFGYITDHLLRVTKPGRLCAVHVANVPTTKTHDGVIGIKDFRGDVVRHFTDHGWIYHGEITIDKDPQAQAIRTKAKGLLFVQKNKDRSWLRQALADYILVFRKPGENTVPIQNDEVSNDDWIKWARPVWYGIRESDTLNVREARSERDERHITPLQLETIRRCILLWSNPGDVVLSPFAGIGSEGYVAIEQGRRFIGCELKESYYKTACVNLRRAEQAKRQPTLFDALEVVSD